MVSWWIVDILPSVVENKLECSIPELQFFFFLWFNGSNTLLYVMFKSNSHL